MENPQRQPLGTIHQQYPPHHHHHGPSTNTLDDIEDAEIIVIDTPEKPSDSLENQFAQVDEEFHESRSTMDIDSDDPTTEPDDTDTESTLNSTRICVPSTTRHDREELRIVRNNFAEEYDPWDTSMVPDYAEDIFRYMRELEVPFPGRQFLTFLVPNDSQSALHGPSTRVGLAHAPSPHRLANPSPRPLPPPPRNPLPHRKHNRPIPHPPQRPRKQTPTRRRNRNLHRLQIRRNHMSLRRRNRLHGRQWV